MTQPASRLPTYFVSHGGGPWPWIVDQLPGDFSRMTASLQEMAQELGDQTRAVLCVSAHWEEPEFTVQTSSKPPMVYDYGGFPEFTYQIQYPAPGAPEVAARAAELLEGAGITSRSDARRGYDHGVFAPLFVSWPDASMPIAQLSIKRGYDVDTHLAVGRALAPLREEGVAIVGSGFSYHNLRLMGPAGAAPSAEFDAWLTDAVVATDPTTRTERLRHWDQAPSARVCHPAEDHLIPLMVAVGAAEDEPGTRVYHQDDFFGSITASSFRFGDVPAHAST